MVGFPNGVPYPMQRRSKMFKFVIPMPIAEKIILSGIILTNIIILIVPQYRRRLFKWLEEEVKDGKG